MALDSVAPTETEVSPPKTAADTGEEIASLLLADGVLSTEKLDHAKRVRAKLVGERSLLSVLGDLGMVSREALQKTLRNHQHAVRVGALLVELGHLRPAELDAALAIQRDKNDGRRLGEILVDEHFIEDYRFAEVLAFQLGLRHVEANSVELDAGLVSKAPLTSYRTHAFLPVGREDGIPVVSFADPLDAASVEAAREIFGAECVVAITTRRALGEVLTLLEKGATRAAADEQADESTVVGIFQNLVRAALRDRVSDIHIEPMTTGVRVRFRRDGILDVHKDYPSSVAAPLATRIKILSKADIAEKRRPQEGRILHPDPDTGTTVDLRASFFSTIFGEKIVIRILGRRRELVDLEQLGMAPKMLERFRDDALDLPSGVLIVTGPAGSGRTTTLYSGVKYLNDIHTSITTVEDPIAIAIEGIGQCSIDPVDVTYEETLEHIVRQDPDVVVLGDIRDAFSADTAVRTAITGRKVLATFHGEDCVGGLLRLMHMDVESFLIASTVACVVAQRLLRRVCPHCTEPYSATPRDLQRLGWTAADAEGCSFRHGRGCEHCRFKGYAGRAGVFELLVLDERVRNAILEEKASREIRRIARESSRFVTLLEDGIHKASTGIVSVADVVRMLPRVERARPIDELRRVLGVSA